MGDATSEAYEAYEAFQQMYLAPLVEQPYEDGIEDTWRGQSVYAELVRAEQERHNREMDAWRAEYERGYLVPIRRTLIDVVIDGEAAKVARPAIGKPLSRRARRRNRGRVRAAKLALGRVWHQSVRWSWPNIRVSDV